ncbi:hypothetical protein EMCRGX_G019936 [Ephydatia muelleri]|eukprot:Em0011g79a
MALTTGSELPNIVAVKEVHAFIVRCMEAVGTPADHATALAKGLIAADSRGHYSHGLNRLEMYVNEVKSGQCDGKAKPEIVKQTVATAFVDGKNGIGFVVGNYCMELAIVKAKDAGIGWVTCTGSNHYGIAGQYAMQALDHGLLGMSFTNSSPLVVPTRAKQNILGTNPIAVAAPACSNEDSFVLDMATSTAALGKVEMERRKGNSIPSGWGVDSSGKESHDPSAVVGGGGLMPLGGSELTAGYKGYGLAMMVDVFCGILSGGPFAHHVRKWQADASVANLGQTFVAVDPKAFAPGFEERMSAFSQEMRAMEPVDPNKPVLVAGDPERCNEERVKREGGIRYHDALIGAMSNLAERLGVSHMSVQRTT